MELSHFAGDGHAGAEAPSPVLPQRTALPRRSGRGVRLISISSIPGNFAATRGVGDPRATRATRHREDVMKRYAPLWIALVFLLV